MSEKGTQFEKGTRKMSEKGTRKMVANYSPHVSANLPADTVVHGRMYVHTALNWRTFMETKTYQDIHIHRKRH